MSRDTDARYGAVQVIYRVIGQKQSLTTALDDVLQPFTRAPSSTSSSSSRSLSSSSSTQHSSSKKTRKKAQTAAPTPTDSTKTHALIKHLSFGTLRWFYRLDWQLKQLLERPLPDKHLDILCCLLLGLYQLQFTRMPAYAVVNSTVALAKKFRKPWATRLINGCLRQFIREHKQNKYDECHDSKVAYTAHPTWLIQAVSAAWPSDWERILFENNQLPPQTLRINVRQIDREAYARLLTEAGIAYHYPDNHPYAIVIESPQPPTTLPGYHEGWFSIQDAAGQRVAPLLELAPNQRVLDACAAPGSKASHLLELEPQLETLTLIDMDASRCPRIHDNLARLCLIQPDINLMIQTADATQPNTWWDGRPYDCILLDAPCSATGVIRRHPDIKLLRQPSDILALTQRQGELLRTLWTLLKPGGRLIYATCSILPEENEGVIRAFLAETSDAVVIPLSFHPSVETKTRTAFGYQWLPGEAEGDGFYVCSLMRTANTSQGAP